MEEKLKEMERKVKERNNTELKQTEEKWRRVAQLKEDEWKERCRERRQK